MKNEVKELVLGVKETLKDFATGRITRGEALDRYTELGEQCARIEESGGGGNDALKGALFRHNAGNFSLFSGVFLLRNDSIRPVRTHGEGPLGKAVVRLGAQIAAGLHGDEVFTLPLGERGPAANTVYVCPLHTHWNSVFILIAVSSSQFFSRERFRETALSLRDLYRNIEYEIHPLFIDRHAELRREIAESVSKTLKSSPTADARLYIFDMIDRIFSHMGTHGLSELSTSILETLKVHFGGNSSVWALSLKHYLMITPGMEAKLSKKKIGFLYKGITIPYRTLSHEIESIQTVELLWDEIQAFDFRRSSRETQR